MGEKADGTGGDLGGGKRPAAMSENVHGYLILTNAPVSEWCHQILARRQVIGRSKHAEIRVPDQFSYVSRKHAEVWKDRRGYWIRDLNSQMGTRLNGIWIDTLPQARLQAGDSISLGDFQLQLVFGSSPEDFMGDENPKDDGDSGTSISLRPRATDDRGVASELSRAELDVVLWMSRGYLNDDQLGHLLHRSPHTVRTQVGSILRKTQLHSRAEIIGWLRQNQIRKNAK